MKGIIVLSALTLLAFSTASAQFTVDYPTNLSATVDRSAGTSAGESRTWKDWAAMGLTFESSGPFASVDAFRIFASADPTGGVSAQSILVPAFTAILTSFEWSLQTTFLAIGQVFERKADSDDTYTMVSRCWRCDTSQNSGG